MITLRRPSRIRPLFRREHDGGAIGSALLAFTMLWLVLPFTALAQAPVSLQGSSGRDCASCHLPWVESFRRSDAVLLMDRPPDSFVADTDNCLGCHDGAVGDARRRVWVEHGHKTGVAPPESMKVPKELPLSDGKVACRTCHTAHSGSGPETLATTIFLRVQNDAGQLCMMCHTQYVKGPAQGSHPLGEMKIALPEVLKANHAHAGQKDHTLNCQSCHTPHGEREAHLLVLPAENRALCLSCHQELAPELWKGDKKHPHPQDAKLVSDTQRQAIKDLHTRTGPGDTLICLSCHKMHTAVPGTHILADTSENSSLCLRCHAEKKPVIGTDHDLRRTAPEAVNLAKQSALTGGPCSACHGVHRPSREPAPAPADPSGQCVTCHSAGQCAEKKTGQPLSHPFDASGHRFPADLGLKLSEGFPDKSRPTVACLTCHNPHESDNGHFLRVKNDTLCETCHGLQARMASGEHDFTRHAEMKNAKGLTAAETGKCGFCHAVHDAKGPMLWAATSQPSQNANDLCVACHTTGGLAAKTVPGELQHPSGAKTAEAVRIMKTSLPLFDEKGHESSTGFVACATCHNPHAGKEPRAMLRVAPDEQPSSMCVTCHANAQPLPFGMHAPSIIHHEMKNLPQAALDVTCGPCHSTHAKPGSPPNGMWTAPLAADSQMGMGVCLGCHSKSGGASPITPMIHPAVFMQNVGAPGETDYVPLFDENGRESSDGQISCQTCHLPHGSPELAKLVAGRQLNLDELRALHPMVRMYEAPSLCTACHGTEALTRFLYFHRPEKRQGLAPHTPR